MCYRLAVIFLSLRVRENGGNYCFELQCWKCIAFFGGHRGLGVSAQCRVIFVRDLPSPGKYPVEGPVYLLSVARGLGCAARVSHLSVLSLYPSSFTLEGGEGGLAFAEHSSGARTNSQTTDEKCSRWWRINERQKVNRSAVKPFLVRLIARIRRY